MEKFKIMIKKYYAYFLLSGERGICESWEECEKLVKGARGARHKAFKTKEGASEWLNLGAKYGDYKTSQKDRTYFFKKKNLNSGIYFDSGTGRGMGVEISVTDENGKDLLDKVLSKKKLNKYHKHLVKGVTNNYGELLACYYALQIAMKEKKLKVFGDSKLVIDYWSKRRRNKKAIPEETLDLISKVYRLRLKFKKNGGDLFYISGDDNPADLGFHR